MQTLRVNNLRISSIKNAKVSGYYFYMNLNIWRNFQICISVPLINSYFYSNFNLCPLAWMFSSAKSLNKVESLQKRASRFLYEDYLLSYEELLQKVEKKL